MKKHLCLSTGDLHGNFSHYAKIKQIVIEQSVSFVFLYGDLLPKAGGSWHPGSKTRTIQAQKDFIDNFLLGYLQELGRHAYVYAIFGNDDFRSNYPIAANTAGKNVLFLNNAIVRLPVPSKELYVAGYPYVSLTPFLQKDWEKWDFKDDKQAHKIYKPQGYTSENGDHYPIDFDVNAGGRSAIAEDLAMLARQSDPEKTVYIFHEPPFNTPLDKVASDNKFIKDSQPHVGSKAIRKFIQKEQPLLTMHGHIHETFQESGAYLWKDKASTAITASHDFTSEPLAYVLFTLPDAGSIERFVL